MFAAIRRIAPRRGWRAFAGEVGIIVLGVLIAVGIGKVVEAFDWRDKVATAQRGMDAMIRDDAFPNLRERIIVARCLDRQLAALEARATARDGAAIPMDRRGVIRQLYVHPSRFWDRTTWASVIADNVPAHMAVDDRLYYQAIDGALEQLAVLNDSETLETADLDLLAGPIGDNPALQADLLRTIARERRRTAYMTLIASQTLATIATRQPGNRLTRADMAQMNTVAWCRANRLL